MRTRYCKILRWEWRLAERKQTPGKLPLWYLSNAKETTFVTKYTWRLERPDDSDRTLRARSVA